ncbi:transglycosylase domain-containing protein [Fibrobacter sp.]|uniref:transglycosylase domain-containing protein n=1 Tax=Fibrobacter sp. TaxID=35828 RepID=UPI002609E6D0|nr:transglycosylase domain-containing protein [Fibrobacter sp.]MDD5942353.1 transglycosylase domain-containing protein [Fibrobacter sp.]
MHLLKKLLKIVAAFALVGLICCIPAYIVVFKILPTQDPDNQFNRATILQVLSGETRVYYNDGEQLLGAFFDANHRVYVPYGDIPANIVNALIAAEDAGYWNHDGFSIYGFTRAMVSNLKSGHMRQGGSTLTQQTVKNIFGREERSVKEKGKELINALRMENHFSKEEILEFYLNQFHVSGTGKGVAIAAQYFFNKDLKDLTLAECAFIAGSVKGPFNYDPFIQRNAERREKALARGKERLEYVLGRMVEENYISQEDMDAALAKPLEFNHGNFRFSVSTMLDRIEEKLDGEFFQKKFEAEGIEDWRKAQLSITTTVDARSQDTAKTALQANISGLQMQLGGFVLPKAQFANRAQTARKGDYLYGTIDSITVDEKGSLKSLTLGFGQLKGMVSEAAVKDFAKKAGGDVNKILAPQLKKGAILLVSVMDDKLIDGFAQCQIETEPVLQGGLFAIQNGNVIASQGGFHNTGFDRSFKAVRQLGSSWKPILYALALKYHWHYLDMLENDFNVFQFVNQFYFPRPDHKNKGDVVSIAWATTRSENIASIWLLEHLLDKVPLEEFNEVAAANGYARTEDEDTKKYFERLRDKFGLILKEDVKREIEFTKARDALAERYKNEGKDDKARDVMNLRYGTFNDIAIKQAKKDSKIIAFINHNYKRYAEILRNRQAQELDPTAVLTPLDSVVLYDHFTLADMKRLSTMIEPVDGEADYLDAEHIRYWPDFRRSLSFAEYARFAKEIGIKQKLQKVFSMPLGVNDITLAEISTAYQTMLTGKVFKCLDGDWTDPCFIKEIKNRDGKVIFRNKTESKVVLGDTITSQMAVMLHSVFVNGTARSQYSSMTVTSPDSAITLRYPALGKTGTTNDYRNVAFMGALPTYVNEKNGISTDSVVAIGSYVGFDDNKPLKSGRTRIAGASGGLPQWADFAKKEIEILGIPEKIDFLDISMLAAGEVPLVLPNERGQLTVDPMTGNIMAGADAAQGRPLPWIDVPGFTPPQVQNAAAETAAENGIIVSLPMPATEQAATAEPPAPSENTEAAPQTASGENTTATTAAPQAAENTVATEPDTPTAAPASAPAENAAATQPAQPAQPKAAAMPKDDDWDLPAGFDSKNAFVPIEAE